jgi:hypothetical protein
MTVRAGKFPPIYFIKLIILILIFFSFPPNKNPFLFCETLEPLQASLLFRETLLWLCAQLLQTFN